MSFLLNYLVIPFSGTEMANAVGNGMSGLMSGFMGGFIAILVHVRTAGQ